MKKIAVSLYFIISMVICGGLVAQNNDIKENKQIENPVSPQVPESDNAKMWRNSFERLTGVRSLEKTIVDDNGEEKKFHPGTFMIVHPDASYTIFVHCDAGAIITSQGSIIIESSDQYVEVISHHVNKYFIGVSNSIDYKLGPVYLHKSFWVDRDREGGDYKRQVNEVWKRGAIPEIIIQ